MVQETPHDEESLWPCENNIIIMMAKNKLITHHAVKIHTLSSTLTLVTHHVFILNPFILTLSPTILLLCWIFKSTLCNICFLEIGKSLRACSIVIGISLSKYFPFRFGSSSSHSYFFPSPFASIPSRLSIHSIQNCSECWSSSGLDTITASRRNHPRDQLWHSFASIAVFTKLKDAVAICLWWIDDYRKGWQSVLLMKMVSAR